MHISRQQGVTALALASCAAVALSTARATLPASENGANGPAPAATAEPSARASYPKNALRVASQDMAERYHHAYRLIGSMVLNLDGQRIGQVDNLILDDHGEIKQVMVALLDHSDADGGSIAISPHRAEVVSTRGAHVTVIRVDLTREEIALAQFTRLKEGARAPAQRGSGMPELHREYGTLY